jgi:predicted nucleic acid-binding Zn finger protein
MRNRLTWEKKAGLVQDLQMHVLELTRAVDELEFRLVTMDALVAAAERRRLDRSEAITVVTMAEDASRINAVIQGETGKYNTRITLKPQRGHHCTCPDWERNGRRVGPCKHVLALALTYKREKLLGRAKELEKLGGIVRNIQFPV